MRKIIGAVMFAAAVVVIWPIGSATADSPPKRLFGKTVVASWTLDAVVKDEGGQEHRPHIRFDALVYVSTTGRLFMRGTVSRGGLTAQRDRDPGASGADFQVRWAGNRLLMSGSFIKGAAQESVDFDADYRSCSLSVVMGKQNGEPIVWRSALNGQVYQIISSNVVSESCDIRDGNALVGQ
jgi:hypothetical protein